MIKELSDSSFEQEVLKSSTPYLVDFWASWCAPCTMIAATVDAIAEKYDTRLLVGKLNVDENPTTVDDFGVMGIPTLLLFVNGKVAEKFIGVVPRADIERAIDEHV